MAKYITFQAGLKSVEPISTSVGVSDALKIVQTNSSGKLDSSLLPYSPSAPLARVYSSIVAGAVY